MASQVTVCKEVGPQFLWLPQAALGERVIVDHICDKPPLITEDRDIPKEEGLFDRVWLLLHLSISTAQIPLDINLVNLVILVQIVQCLHVLLHHVILSVFVDQDVVLNQLVKIGLLAGQVLPSHPFPLNFHSILK